MPPRSKKFKPLQAVGSTLLIDVLSAPLQLIELIFTFIKLDNSTEHCLLLYNIVTTCKECLALGNSEALRPLWEQAYLKLSNQHPQVLKWNLLASKKAAICHASTLVPGKYGCQGCDLHPKTRKICWEFGFRICKDCTIKRTICDYYLNKDFCLPASLYSGLPFTVVMSRWSRYGGSRPNNFRLITSVNQNVRDVTGFADMSAYRDAAMEKERERQSKSKSQKKAKKAPAIILKDCSIL